MRVTDLYSKQAFKIALKKAQILKKLLICGSALASLHLMSMPLHAQSLETRAKDEETLQKVIRSKSYGRITIGDDQGHGIWLNKSLAIKSDSLGLDGRMKGGWRPVIRPDHGKDLHLFRVDNKEGNLKYIKNLEFQYGHATSSGLTEAGTKMPTSGGAFYIPGVLLQGIKNVSFANNEAQDKGGAIFTGVRIEGGIFDSQFIDNKAGISGGAIYFKNALKGGIVNNQFKRNSARNGGTIYGDGTLESTIKNSEFSNNQAQDKGGAIFAKRIEGGIFDSQFISNKAGGRGGAIYFGEALKGGISNSKFEKNSAQLGGAIYGEKTIEGTIEGSEFIANESQGDGGAINAREIKGTISNSSFTNNVSHQGKGGALYIDEYLSGGIENSQFINNKAGNLGGAIFHNAGIKQERQLDLRATGGKSLIFYGNRSHVNGQEQANAIYLGNIGDGNKENNKDRTTLITLGVDEGSHILMFDPLKSQKDGATNAAGDVYGNLRVDVTKTGIGDWLLGGVSSMQGAGNWTIDQGALRLVEVDGVEAAIHLASKTAQFSVGSEATLSGSGTIAAAEIVLSGMLDPSSLSKTGMGLADLANISDKNPLNLGMKEQSYYGTLFFDNSSSGKAVEFINATYIADVGWDENNHHSSDMIRISEDATIQGGLLNVRSHISHKDDNDLYSNHDVVIMESLNGKISGQFERVESDFAFWKTQLDYVDNQLILHFIRDNAVRHDVKQIATTANQRQIAQAIIALGDSHPIMGAIIDMKTDEVQRAFNNISGEIYASSRGAVLRNSHIGDRIIDRLQQTTSHNAHLPNWATSFGYDGHILGNDNAARLDSAGHGLAFGLDGPGSDNFFTGIVLGQETMRLTNGQARNSRIDVTAHELGGYWRFDRDKFHLGGGVIYSLLDWHSKRDIWVAGAQHSLASTPQADYHGHKWQIFATMSADLSIGQNLTLSPYLNLTQSWLHTNAAHEQNSLAALDMRSSTDKYFASTIGLRGSYRLATKKPVTLHGNIGWTHGFGKTHSTTTNALHNHVHDFTIDGVGFNRDSGFVELGADMQLSDKVSLDVGYHGHFAHHLSEHSATLQLKIHF